MCPEELKKSAYMELVLSQLCFGFLYPGFAFHLSPFLSCWTLPNFLTTPDTAKHARPWKNHSPKPLEKSKRRSYTANLLSPADLWSCSCSTPCRPGKITQEFCHLPRENCRFNWPLRHGELMKRCRNTTPSIQTPDLASTRIVASHAPHAKPAGQDARLFPCPRLWPKGPARFKECLVGRLSDQASPHHPIFECNR